MCRCGVSAMGPEQGLFHWAAKDTKRSNEKNWHTKPWDYWDNFQVGNLLSACLVVSYGVSHSVCLAPQLRRFLAKLMIGVLNPEKYEDEDKDKDGKAALENDNDNDHDHVHDDNARSSSELDAPQGDGYAQLSTDVDEVIAPARQLATLASSEPRSCLDHNPECKPLMSGKWRDGKET